MKTRLATVTIIFFLLALFQFAVAEGCTWECEGSHDTYKIEVVSSDANGFPTKFADNTVYHCTRKDFCQEFCMTPDDLCKQVINKQSQAHFDVVEQGYWKIYKVTAITSFQCDDGREFSFMPTEEFKVKDCRKLGKAKDDAKNALDECRRLVAAGGAVCQAEKAAVASAKAEVDKEKDIPVLEQTLAGLKADLKSKQDELSSLQSEYNHLTSNMVTLLTVLDREKAYLEQLKSMEASCYSGAMSSSLGVGGAVVDFVGSVFSGDDAGSAIWNLGAATEESIGSCADLTALRVSIVQAEQSITSTQAKIQAASRELNNFETSSKNSRRNALINQIIPGLENQIDVQQKAIDDLKTHVAAMKPVYEAAKTALETCLDAYCTDEKTKEVAAHDAYQACFDAK